MKKRVYLGFDFGASSGRAILGEIRGRCLKLREIHRFPNEPVEMGGTLYWNLPALWSEVLEGLRKCRDAGFRRLDGIGVDTWGVDFGLLGRDGRLLGNPVHYRDARTEGVERRITRGLSASEVYRVTGLAVGRVSTLAQLVAMHQSGARRVLGVADRFLMMSDLLRYFLSGQAACELTAAGSSQLLDIHTAKWSPKIFRAFDLPMAMMPGLVRPGTRVGPLSPTLANATGLKCAPVIAVAGHDTASAAAAAPITGPGTAFLSSGTWSVLGIAGQQPITTEAARRCGFVNEFGFRSILFAKNLMGLYLVENLRRAWAKQGVQLSYADMVKAASRAKPFKFFFDINSPIFFAAEEQVEDNARTFLRKTGRKGTPSRGELVRSLLEALAFTYRGAFQDLQALTGRTYRRISLIGGGSRNALLCQFTADATGLEVVAGPAEATVIGNLALQAFAAGQLRHAADIQELVTRSFQPVIYRPRQDAEWTRQFEHYQQIGD